MTTAWAAGVAGEARRLREAGVPARTAFARAVALHQPGGVIEAPPAPPAPPRTPQRARVIAFLREQTAPVTARQVAEALGNEQQATRDLLSRCAVRVGTRITNGQTATVWALAGQDVTEPPAVRVLPEPALQIRAFLAAGNPAAVPDIERATGLSRSAVNRFLPLVGTICGSVKSRNGRMRLWTLRSET